MAAPMGDERNLLRKIKYFAFVSRFCLILLQIVFNVCLPDHEADAFQPPQYDKNPTVTFLLGGFRRWDAIYFMHIAEFGYTYENTLAFFQGFPFAVEIVANTLLYPLRDFVGYSSVLLISAIVVNLFLFVKNSENLYKLGKHVTQNDKLAYTAALLYCINPASVFMTAPYSETLFTYLTIKGLLYLEENKSFKSSLFIGFSCFVRSNGLLNIGYLLFVLGKNSLKELNSLLRLVRLNKFALIYTPLIFIITTLLPYFLLIVISLVPFAWYQAYGYIIYCDAPYLLAIPDHVLKYGRAEGLKVPRDPASSWCNDTVPLAYSFIQTHYWHQGLFAYWELKQIPNFLLATPVAVLVVVMALNYYRHNKYICWTLGLDDVGALKKQSDDSRYYQLTGVKLLPYVIHAVVLLVFGWFCIHVQVLTRLLFSSNLILYWYVAQLVFPDIPNQDRKYNKYDVTKQDDIPSPVETEENRSSVLKNLLMSKILNFTHEPFATQIILVYFLSYFVIGTALYSNFLPWT